MSTPEPSPEPCLAVIGGGPAGLMAAEVLSQAGQRVDLFDSMPSPGRKFLVAGRGGLNLTHAEEREQFLSRYGSRRNLLEPFLEQFGPVQLRAWAAGLGIQTFIGSSRRVFPLGMKAAPLLRAWLSRLRSAGVSIHTRHTWTGWDEQGALQFTTPQGVIQRHALATILALGGGSWRRLGSTGEWVALLRARGIRVAPLEPSNCGFEVAWSKLFHQRFEGTPLKSIGLSFTDLHGQAHHVQGDLLLTRYGVEGSLIYGLSAPLRDTIAAAGKVVIHLDLAPDWTEEHLVERLSLPWGTQSLSNHLRKAVRIQGAKAGLLHELVPKQDLMDPRRLAMRIKDLAVPLLTPRPLEEAISSAGGVVFEELDEQLMLRSRPGVFCAGEMLDWEAPTGGYLITACMATGRAAGLGAMAWLASNDLRTSSQQSS